jgi:nitroimidazol reductase NimA-like FMN-containing flavoprotein (pyridoxamine 5'-phosphate oxidase superfamily)
LERSKGGLGCKKEWRSVLVFGTIEDLKHSQSKERCPTTTVFGRTKEKFQSRRVQRRNVGFKVDAGCSEWHTEVCIFANNW